MLEGSGAPPNPIRQVSEPKRTKEQIKRTGEEAISGDNIDRFSRISDTVHRGKLTAFIRHIFGFAVVATFGIYALQGFHLWGFDLPIQSLNWLGGATICEIITLAIIAFRYYFTRNDG